MLKECMATRHCTGCDRDLSPDLFNKGQSRCKECKKEVHRQWSEKNKEHLGAYKKRWFDDHKEATKQSKKKYYKTHRDHLLAGARLLRYGLTQEGFTALLERQGHRCAICGTDKPHGKGGWHVDHDHDTKKVRGLLCNGCNLGIGHLGDDPERMESAAAYIRKHQAPADQPVI